MSSAIIQFDFSDFIMKCFTILIFLVGYPLLSLQQYRYWSRDYWYPGFIQSDTVVDKKWINYEKNNLRNWNNEILVNGLFFSSSIQNPMAFHSHEEGSCQLVIPMNSDENDTNFEWSPVLPSKPVTCPDQENGNTYWIDPRNWNSVSVTNATPHIERLPCIHDRVGFENTSDLYIIVPDKPIRLRGFYWYERMIHEFNFDVVMRREEFLKNFVVTGTKEVWETITLKMGPCANQTGCDCGTYHLYKETCKLLRDQCNTQLACLSPIKPFGHCCHMCGCTMRILFDPSSFIFKKLQTIVKKLFENDTELIYHLSKIPGNYVQLVVIKSEDTNDDYGHLYLKIAQLETLLQSDDPSLSHLSESILNIDLSCSESTSHSSRYSLSFLSHLLLPAFGIASFVILAILVYQSKISPSKLQNILEKSFSFVKFENHVDEVEDNKQSQAEQQQKEEGNSENMGQSNNTESELHSERRSEKGSSSDLDYDSVFVEHS